MTLPAAYQDAEDNSMNDYWNSLREKKYDASFESVKEFIKEKEAAMQRSRRYKRRWQWMTVALIPLLVLLACTRTEHTEPVGHALTFTVPQANGLTMDQIKNMVGSKAQVLATQDTKQPGVLSYACFVPASSMGKAEGIFNQLKTVQGISQLQMTPVNTRVKESLLSRFSYKIFKTHIDASALSDAALKATVESQLQSSGITQVGVSIVKNKDGQRMIKLLPKADSGDYHIDLRVDDGRSRTELVEEQRTEAAPGVDVGAMTDPQIRDFIRQRHGAAIRDEDIQIDRSGNVITIRFKQGPDNENVVQFKVKP